MKKMTFALACASTFALFADPISVTGFEGSNGYGAESAESGSLWSYAAASDSTDSSAAKAYEGSDVSAPTITRPKQALEGDNLKFLDLSTEGGILWRKFAAEGSHTVPATGTYIDTMVQFTATEDGNPPEVDTEKGDKLALWLDKAEDGTLTLKVLANAFTFDENGPAPAETPFALTTSDGSELVLAENAWYRLTVQSIANVLGAGAPGTIQGFQIYVNGVRMKAASGEPFAAAFVDFMDTYKTAALTDKTVFASLQEMGNLDNEGNPLTPATLASVGFKGSGKIDDLVLTDDDPFELAPAPDAISFTITAEADTTVEWSTDGKTWADYEAGAKAPAGPLYVRLTNADGATKILTKELSSDSSTFDVSTETFGWAEYLGDVIDGAYVIDDAAELVRFQKGVATLGSSGVTFKLGASIVLTDPWPGVGLRTAESEQYAADNAAELTAFTASAKDLVSWAVAGTEVKKGNVTQAVGDARKAAYLAGAFRGTFDGGDHTISGVSLVKGDYVGFFNSTYGATIKNLKLAISGTGFADSATADFGGGVVAGVTVDTTIQNCQTVADGTFTGSKAVAGIVGYAGSGTVLEGCVNNLAVSSANEKVAGLVACAQNGNAQAYGENGVSIKDCTNTGNVTCTKDDRTRAALLVSYSDCEVKFQGTITARGTVTQAGSTGDIQSIININGGSATVVDGAVITAPATMKSTIHNGKAHAGLNYATVADGVATFVADSAAAVSGANLKVMTTGNTVTLANVGDSITLDTTLATVTVTTTAENAEVKQEGNVYTVVAKSAAEDWPEDPSTVAGQTAGDAFNLEGELADAEADKLATWAKANNVAYAGAAEAINVEAFLLNVANTEKAIADGKANFKIPSISIDANGTVTVADPEGSYNGVITIKGSVTVNGTYNLDKADKTARFFKAFLSVK